MTNQLTAELVQAVRRCYAAMIAYYGTSLSGHQQAARLRDWLRYEYWCVTVCWLDTNRYAVTCYCGTVPVQTVIALGTAMPHCVFTKCAAAAPWFKNSWRTATNWESVIYGYRSSVDPTCETYVAAGYWVQRTRNWCARRVTDSLPQLLVPLPRFCPRRVNRLLYLLLRCDLEVLTIVWMRYDTRTPLELLEACYVGADSWPVLVNNWSHDDELALRQIAHHGNFRNIVKAVSNVLPASLGVSQWGANLPRR